MSKSGLGLSAICTNDELRTMACGRRPKPIAADFSFVHYRKPLFTPPPYVHTDFP